MDMSCNTTPPAAASRMNIWTFLIPKAVPSPGAAASRGSAPESRSGSIKLTDWQG